MRRCENIEALAAALDALAQRRWLQTAGRAFEAGAPRRGRASQGIASAALGGFEAVVRAGNPLTEKARAQARSNAHVSRVMGSGIAGERAREALARDLREARVGSLHAGSKCRIEPVGTGIEALARHRDQILGPRQSALGGFEIAALGFERAAHGDGEPKLELAGDLDEIGIFRHGPFGGLRGRGRARVGDEIDQRPVGLVADGGDDGNGARGHGADDDFLVEAPEIFQAAATAGDDQHVGARDFAARLNGIEAAHGGRDLGGAAFALHAHGPDEHARRKALLEAVQHVADDGAGGAGDDADDPGQVRQRLLAAFLEQAFGGEALLALLELHHEGAEAGGLERFDDDLIFRRAGERRDLADGNDLHAFLGLDLELAPGAAPDDGLDLGLVVLEGKVAVARGVGAAIARNLAAQPHVAEAVLERAFDRVRQLGDGEFGDVLAAAASGGWGVSHELFPCSCQFWRT